MRLLRAIISCAALWVLVPASTACAEKDWGCDQYGAASEGDCEPRSCWEHLLGRPLPPQALRSVPRTSGLPVGRTYYGGRYFGNFNNRFFGPQYGYF